ncbi:hypothetical protein [Sphingomonas faeni]|uniref:hypothetical protein n=1 Tax=Sphingomonas faeni TaxID=185950 RepID=UPI003359700E
MGLLEELAVRCEAATGADRELDCLIWAEVTEQKVVWTGGDGHLLVIGDSAIGSIDPGKHSRNFSCNRQPTGPGSIPAYTGSLEAGRSIWDDWDHCEVYRPDHQTLGWTVHMYGNANAWRGSVDGFAPTEAAAWTAASLRGLALSKGSDT